MIVTYLRSSSMGTFKMCEQKFFLNYVIGLPSPSNLAAVKGSVCHKVLECMALGKLAVQNGEKTYDAEELGILEVDTMWDFDLLLDLSIAMYEQKEKVEFSKKDRKDCREWTNNELTWTNGAYDPRNLHIVSPEQHFDFEIKEDWARYSYKIGDQTLDGYLGLRGTIDLITLEDEQLSIIDHKSGGRKNWKTFKTKEYEDLEQDIQFLLYYYACSVLYPEYDSILFTVFWMKDGGPFTFLYDRSMLPGIEKRIRGYFEDIKKVQIPKMEIGKQCSFCAYSKISHKYQDSPCAFFNEQVLKKGINQVVAEYGDKKVFSTYDGGGRQIEKEIK